jgi:hypothetical protein
MEFVWKVPLGCQISKSEFFLVSRPQSCYQKRRKMCSSREFAQQNSRNLPNKTLGIYLSQAEFVWMSNFEILYFF